MPNAFKPLPLPSSAFLLRSLRTLRTKTQTREARLQRFSVHDSNSQSTFQIRVAFKPIIEVLQQALAFTDSQSTLLTRRFDV